MQKHVVALIVTSLALFMLCLCGCGGSSTTQPAMSVSSGKVSLSILFPARKGIRTIPQATESILITVTGDGILAGKPFRKGYDRPALGQSQEVDAVLILPLGAKTILAEARDVSASDAEQFNSGNTLASEQQTITLDDSSFFTPVALTLNLQVTVPQPTITGFSPTTIHVGDTLTITGTGFDTNLTDQFVRFSGYNPVAPLTATATQITVKIPSITVGSYSVGIFPTQGASYAAPGTLHVILEGTLQQINWTYSDNLTQHTGTGPTFSYTNSTPDQTNYFKASATLTVPATVTYGVANTTTTTKLAVNFTANVTWDTSGVYLGDAFNYVMPQNVVLNAASSAAYAMSVTLVSDSNANSVAIQASPQFADGTTSKSITHWTSVESRTYNWAVETGNAPYNPVLSVTATYVYH